MYWGYQNPLRINDLRNDLTKLDLEQILSGQPPGSLPALSQDESCRRMVSVFLWQQGRFKRFLHLIATHDKAGYPTYFEAAMQMPVTKIIPIWRKYLNDVAVQESGLFRLPSSQILDDESQFNQFVRQNNISLEQPKPIE